MFPFGSTIKHIELYRIIGVKISQSCHVLKVYLFIPTRESKQVTSELAIIACFITLSTKIVIINEYVKENNISFYINKR